MSKVLPSQRPLTGAEATIASMMDTSTVAGKAIVAGNLVFNLIMSMSLNQLWSMINT